ncbi:MAG: cytochrome C [Betaproteobacteria bacterium HGW-Betaproteobacteria-7]|nr:MAG: cytochrome C [Betaproteobacteria bacterium HGW-Betaproteobacteria-7]
MKKYFATCALSLIAAVLSIAPVSVEANEPTRILRRANCFVCHSVESKRIGPAYKDVAARYQGDDSMPAKLFDKVRKGGAGNWGDVAMSPHPSETISDDDLKAIIHWILSRK